MRKLMKRSVNRQFWTVIDQNRYEIHKADATNIGSNFLITALMICMNYPQFRFRCSDILKYLLLKKRIELCETSCYNKRRYYAVRGT